MKNCIKVIFFVVLLFGVSLPLIQAEDQVKVDFWDGWTTPAEVDVMKGLVQKFNTAHPGIKVEITLLPWTQLYTKFLTEYKGGKPPEVMASHPHELGQFANMGVLDDKLVAQLKLNKANYMDSVWSGTMYNKKQYAAPFDMHMHVLFYNKEMFEKAGIVSPPKTGEKLIAIAQKLTIDKNGKHPNEAGSDTENVVQYGLGFNQHHHVFFQFSCFNESAERKSVQ